jgi:hypothetical protein
LEGVNSRTNSDNIRFDDIQKAENKPGLGTQLSSAEERVVTRFNLVSFFFKFHAVVES